METPGERAERLNDFFGPLAPGLSSHVWDVEVRNETADRTIALFRCTQMVLHPR